MTNLPRETNNRKYGENPSHPLPIWNGILEHRRNIGQAIWEFLWCIDKITVEEDGIGWCLGKSPIKIERIRKDLKEKYDRVRDHLQQLDDLGYITRRRTPVGYIIGVKNSRKFGVWKSKSDLGKTPNHSASDLGKTPNHSDQAIGEKTPITQDVIGENSHERSGKNPLSDSGKFPQTKKTLQKTQQETQQDRLMERTGTAQPRNQASRSGRESNLPKLPRETLAWCRGIILSRASGIVRNQKAYFEKALPEFDFDAELDAWTAQKALTLIRDAMAEKQKHAPEGQEVIVPWDPIIKRLANELGVYKLPWTQESLDRALLTANEMGGFTVHRNVPQQEQPIIYSHFTVGQFLRTCMMNLGVKEAEARAFAAEEYNAFWPLPQDLTKDLGQERFERMCKEVVTWTQKRTVH